MTETLTPYPEYRASDLPWLREIPVHWRLVRAKQLFTQRVEKGHPNAPLLAATQTQGVVLKEKYGSRTVTAFKDLHLLKLVEPGDFVISLRSFEGGIELAHDRGIISPAYTVLKPNAEARTGYFAHFLKSATFIDSLSLYVTGIREGQNIDYNRLSRFELPVPPPDEQDAIGRFLAATVSRTSRLIRTKQRLVALLTEQKQAVIQRAVTRGLDPDAPMKPSGVEWLGDVPSHWTVTQLYRVTDPDRPIMYGIVLPGPNVDNGVFIVKGGNCEPGKLTEKHLSKTTREIESRYVRSRLRKDDVVYSIRGSLGGAELVPSRLAGANLTQDAARIAAGPQINPAWLIYAVRSPGFFRKLDAGAKGAAIRGINIKDLTA